MCNYLLNCSYQLLEFSEAFNEESDYEVQFQNCSTVIDGSVYDLLLEKMQFYSSPLYKTNNKFAGNQLVVLSYEHQNKTHTEIATCPEQRYSR